MGPVTDLHTSSYAMPAIVGMLAGATSFLLSWGSAPQLSLLLAAAVALVAWRTTWRTISLTQDAILLKTAFGSDGFPRRHIVAVATSKGFGPLFDVLHEYKIVIRLDPASGIDGWHIPLGYFDKKRGEQWSAQTMEAIADDKPNDR